MARSLTRAGVALAALQVVQWLAAAALARRSGVGVGAALAVLQCGLLLPLALAAVYTVGSAADGPRTGLYASAVWVLGPLAVVPLWDDRYRHFYLDQFLAPLLGVTHESAFRAAVFVAVSLALTAVSVRRASLPAAAAAGLAASLAAGLDADAVIALGVPALASLAARRPRLAAAAALAAVPGVLALALGDARLPGFPTDSAAWTRLDTNELGFQEYFWSMRLLQWLPLAGAIGLARRSVPLAAALLALVAGSLIVLGSQPAISFGAGSFLPVLVAGAPAYLLLTSFVPLLVPPLPALSRLVRPSASR